MSRRTVALRLPSLLALGVLLHKGASLATAQQAPLTGMLVTLSATVEEAAPVAATPGSAAGGLMLRVTLENRTGADISGLRVQAPIPARAEAAGVDPLGTVDSTSVTWSGLSLRGGGQLGPLTYRVVPAKGADGAVIFREASVRPEVTWSGPSAGRATPPLLRLNGLWGDAALRRTVLPSELTIFTRERPDTPTVSLRIAVRAGSRDENEITSGGSHWLEHAFFLGTTRRPGSVFDSDIGRVGGQTNASTGWEHTDYWHRVPAEEFDVALDVLSDQLLNSTFREEAFDRERRVVFEELKLRNDTPSTLAFDEFINLVFQVSPLRRHPGGTITSVQSIPIPTILAYKDERYVTGNMAVAAAGNLRHDEAVAKIAAAFAGLPRGPRADRPRVPEPVQTEPRRLNLGQGTRTAEVRLGWPAPGDESADAAAMFILQDILGATGLRLAAEIRDRRALATAVSPSYFDFSDAGTLMLAATTQADRVDEVVRLLLVEVQRLRDGDVSDADVQASIRAISGRRALSDESNQGQTGRAIGEVTGTLDSYGEYVARLRAVSAADVQRVARTYLDPANYTLVVVRP